MSQPTVAEGAREIFNRAGLSDMSPVWDRAFALHDFVNNQMAVVPDPDRFEKITSPDELLSNWFTAEATGQDPSAVGGDCDDKALLLSALTQSVGIPSQVVLYDVDGDGFFDHAAVTVLIDGQSVYAETVAPGLSLGEMPNIVGQKTLVV